MVQFSTARQVVQFCSAVYNKPTDNGLWKDAPNSITYPMQSNDDGCWWMGYASVAQIIETGSQSNNLNKGDIVFTHQTHKDYQVIDGDYYKLPKDINPEHASFTMLVEICFNGILDARIKLMDNVVILGMGTLGQLLLQMCKLSGAYVIAADYIDERLQLAEKMGADMTVNPSKDGDLAENVLKMLGDGADAVLEATGNAKALHDAVRCARKDGQVTVLSFYLEPPAEFQMGQEFHHNRVIIRSSQIGAVDPALSNQYDWNKRGNVAVKILSKLNIEPLISHRCSFDEYPKMLEMIDKNPSQCQSVIIKY